MVTLVERGGRVRSFHPVTADGNTVTAIVLDNIRRESRLHTDESRLYQFPGSEFKAHETVTHSHNEYVCGDVHTNTVEGVFSIFKRGMKGIFQHCSEKHLHRYLAEFDFRYNQRTALGYSDGGNVRSQDRPRALRASASRIVCLTEPVFIYTLKRVLGRKKKRHHRKGARRE